MIKATGFTITPCIPRPRLAELVRDAELRRVFLLAERDRPAAAVPAAQPAPQLAGGAARVLECVE